MIKVVTGVRRCGKSSLMLTIIDELLENGVNSKNIIYIIGGLVIIVIVAIYWLILLNK